MLHNASQRIIDAIAKRQDAKRKGFPGALGEFYRNGGNDQLYDVPVRTGDLVIDAGGYEGEWTARMLARYGCAAEVYEPVPDQASHCRRLFERNALVRVHAAGLGGSARSARFSLAATGSSEFLGNSREHVVEAEVVDIAAAMAELGTQSVACLKLNIEGGEYEVLERLLETGGIARCTSLLVQFHRQPPGWERRREAITEGLRATHDQAWCYPMVWEKWVLREAVTPFDK